MSIELGLREAMGSKIRVAKRGADLVELVAPAAAACWDWPSSRACSTRSTTGGAVALAGLFPAEIQNVTLYEMAVAAGSRNPERAGVFVRAFATPEAKKLLAAAGLK